MLRTLVLALVLTGISGSALAPAQTTSALAPFEVVADGFGNLRGLALDGEGHLYVADREMGTVTRLGPEGRRVVARRLDRPVGLALDSQGRVLVAEERGGRVVRLDPAGPTPIIQGIKQPRWLAVSERGTVYVSARRLPRDAEPEPDDESAEPELIVALEADGTLSVLADGFDHLQGLAAGHDELYAATTGPWGAPRQAGVIYRIPILADGRAGSISRLSARGVFERPVGLALDRLGALYVSAPAADLDGTSSRQAIVKLHPEGAATTFAAWLEHPRGLAFDGHGHLYVADGNAGRVLRFLAPAAPALAAVPAFTRQAALTLGGTTQPQARVDVFVNDADVPVSATSSASGSFSAAIGLAANTASSLQVVATAARGKGLSSPPTTAGVVHDTIAPALIFQAPAAGTFVRGQVQVRAEAADAASQLAALSMNAAGQALGAAVAPPLPASSAVATAAWDTTGAADGTQTLTASATDRAGNTATVSRVVIVDNTPPETEIASGPDGPSAQPGVTFVFTGHDHLTPPASLQFAWRLDGGVLSPFTGVTSVALAGLAPGPHAFEVVARDLAGNEDPTPARQEFTVGSATVAIAITSPAAGATVPAEAVVVRGTADLDAGVTVNGFAALVHGGQWAVEVPVRPGENVLTALARAASGAEGTATLTVSGAAAAPGILLRAEPASGLAPLQVAWRVSSQAPRPLVRFELDEDGTGVFGPPVTGLEGVTSTYPTAGLRFPRVRATDDQGNVYVATTLVQADDGPAAAGKFGALWAGFTARLQAGDQPGALTYLSPQLRTRLAPVFQQLGPALPSIASSLGAIELIDQVGHLAEAAILQVEDGAAFLYFIYFRRDNLGRWLIHEM